MVKKKIGKKGYKVIQPKMANPEEPKIESWISFLEKSIGKLDNKTLLIGHSIGCQTIMRYLEKEDFNGKVSCIFIAGWFKLDNLEEDEKDIAKPWINTPIDFGKIRQKIYSLTVFLSSNEPYGFVNSNKSIFENSLGARVIILKDKGHFSEDTGVTELPEILKFIK